MRSSRRRRNNHLAAKQVSEQSLCGLKVFVISRPDDSVQSAFRPLGGIYREDPLQDVTQNEVAQDIRLFLTVKLEGIQREWDERRRDSSNDEQLGTHWPYVDTLQCLVKIAVPLFIFAVIACRVLGDHMLGTQRPMERLNQFIRTAQDCTRQEDRLAKTYLPVLRQFDFTPDGKPRNDRDKDLARQMFLKIVGAILVVNEPALIRSLASLTGYKALQVRNFLSFMGSVLDVPRAETSPYRLFHTSFGDFLLENEKASRESHVDAEQAHRRIALDCLELLSTRRP
ncbi:hypothetical protein LZ30DRAFT_247150 [Colletotrichum cereale]|nr:hypothetical protein LZ30DRAFT_247150 [Colletotrichum cereale]